MPDSESIVELREEVLQLRADLERHRRMVKNKDDMIEEMESELSKTSKCAANVEDDNREREWSEQMRQMHLQLEDRDTIISQKDNLISNLGKEVERLETSNRELVNRTFADDETFHNNSGLEEELSKVKDENSQLHEILNKLVEEHEETKKSLNQLRDDFEAASGHIKTLEHDFNECREEKQRLEGEIFALQNGGLRAASKGNSIFTEAMDAERKLEKEMKSVYEENQKLKAAVKRLEEEKEEAEMMAIGEVRVSSQLCSAEDLNELINSRKKIATLETERRVLWEQFFRKIKTLSNKDIGSLVNAYFEGFKCSIEQLKSTQEETFKKNEELNHKNRNLKVELEAKEVHIQRLKSEINAANRKVNSEKLLKLTQATDNSFMAPPPTPNAFKNAVVADKNENPLRDLANRSTLSVPTPRKEEASDWAKSVLAKREAAKKEREQKENTFVELRMAEPKSTFKASRLAHLSNPDNK